MRMRGNQRLLDPAMTPDLNLSLISPEKMARRKELEVELGALTKEVKDERARLTELAQSPDFDSAKFAEYRIGMLQLQDKQGQVTDKKVDLALLPDPSLRAKPAEPNAFQRWCKNGYAGLSADERKNFTGTPDGMEATEGAQQFRFSDFIRAGVHDRQVFMAPTRSDDATGQQVLPLTIDPTVLQVLKEYGGALNLCRAIRTATGDTRRFLHMDDANQMGQVLGAQASNIDDQDVTVNGVEMTAKTVTSKFITVSVEFLQDDESGMPGIIQDLAYAGSVG